jgi:hypothetical protein
MQKKVFTLVLSVCISLLAAGQNPYANPEIEAIPIPEPSYNIIQAETGGTPTTNRLYVSIPENYEVQFVYGLLGTPLQITAPMGFYQNPLGGPTSLDIVPVLIDANPELNYDSWLTIGSPDSASNNMLVLPDSYIFDTWETGADLNIDDLFGGGVYMTTFGYDPQNSPDVNGRVLLGQFTSGGIVSGCVNLQLRRLNPDGTIYDPPGSPDSETAIFNNICFDTVPDAGCFSDFDDDGIVDVGDLLFVLAEFGCMVNCFIDYDNDDHTTANDLLSFLSDFGFACN